MNRQARIEAVLTTALSPSHLSVVDESRQHAGHNPAAAMGETHYHLTIVSPAFAGKSRIDQHRLVNDLLADEFKTGLHALSLSLSAQ